MKVIKERNKKSHIKIIFLSTDYYSFNNLPLDLNIAEDNADERFCPREISQEKQSENYLS